MSLSCITLLFILDIDLRNIIDKLANFVARNGPKFEELTRTKQKNNPKFAFLFGGDYHTYYKWKVNIEGKFCFYVQVMKVRDTK